MAKVEIIETTYGNFGNCVKISNGIIELYVTTDFGPRIIHFSRVGMENIMYNDVKHTPLGDPIEVFGGDVHKLYGGHRLWISPEILPRCYHPDNDKVAVTKIKNGAEFAATVEKNNGIQKIMTIVVSEGSESVTVEHTIKNVGLWEIELAPWCLTVMAAGGIEIMPQTNDETGFLNNRNFSFWSYSDMSDDRVRFGKNFIFMKQETGHETPYKLGYNNTSGWGAYFISGQAFVKSFDPIEDGFYPDDGCCYETYTNEVMLEVETLGEITIIPPGEEVVHVEEWELYEEANPPKITDDEAMVKKIIDKYVK